MRTKNIKLQNFKASLACVFTSTVLLVLMLEGPPSSFAQEGQPKTFSSPGEASTALFQAAQNGDEQGLEAILGAGREVISSNDEVEDKLERERFSQKYKEMHRLVREPDGLTVLYIGAENWPFPIPLVSLNGAWYFDSDSGIQEIAFRTVGENEITAIQVCHEYAMAKKQGEIKVTSNDDPIRQYAQSLVSAGATNANTNESSPFHGYYFRVKGNSAAGSRDVLTREKKRDLALITYPAEYRSSGIMTFMVTRDGVVYEKDLGPDTASVPQNIDRHWPNSSWHRAE
jgi:Protein of unknown function (DUF2950)